MEDIRVVLWGLGAMGSGVARVLAGRPGIRIVGAVGQRPERFGTDLGQAVGLERSLGVEIQGDPEKVLSESKGDLVVHATASTVKEVTPDIITALEQGYDVVSIAEEMAYPGVQDPERAQLINKKALEAGKTVLGTGINPGFILDTLIVALTGASTEVKSIKARRVNDLSPFGPTVMKTQGVGISAEEFEKGLAEGTVVGHIGFEESIHLIARALGWKLDRVEQTREPIMASEERKGEHITVAPGMVAGCNHSARGYIEGEPRIILEHPQQIQPSAAGIETGDFIQIEGTPPISMAIQPEIPGGIGTIALACNTVGPVITAAPGLITMAELPVPRAVMGDIREAVSILANPSEHIS